MNTWHEIQALAARLPRASVSPRVEAVSRGVESERMHCVFTVFATAGSPTRLQLVVALASALAPSVQEEDVAVSASSAGFFEVDVRRCTEALHRVLNGGASVEAWNAVLASHHGAAVAASRVLRVAGAPGNMLDTNASVSAYRARIVS
jgi:hypothetical protein